MPFFSVIAKDWIEYKKPNLRVSTWEVYKAHTKNHFHDLDDLKINQITTATVEKFITKRQEQGMHILTLRKVLVSLGQVLNYAVRHKYIDHNPLSNAERPRGQMSEKKIKILTPKQINALLDHVTIHSTASGALPEKTVKKMEQAKRKYKFLLTLAVFSGARQGELLGLKWSDIDWRNSQIHIQRTYNNGRFFNTKTKTSNRKIDVGPNVMMEFKKWRLACPNNDLDLIFPNEAGKPINHQNMVNRVFLPTLKTAGLPTIRFHDLRHTYTSLQIDQGENIKYIQTQLGHSNPTVTWNVYAHLMKPTNQEAACRLENTIFGANRSQNGHKKKKGETQ